MVNTRSKSKVNCTAKEDGNFKVPARRAKKRLSNNFSTEPVCQVQLQETADHSFTDLLNDHEEHMVQLDESVCQVSMSEEAEAECTFFTDISLSSSFCSTSALASSTPQKKKRVYGRKNNGVNALRCPRPHCKASVKTMRGLQTHLRNHTLKDAVVKLPNNSEILNFSLTCSAEILHGMISGLKFGIFEGYDTFINGCLQKVKSAQWYKFLEYIVPLIFSNLPTKGVVFGSVLLTFILQQTGKSLGNKEHHDTLTEMLIDIALAPTSVISSFLLEFCLKLCDKVLTFICKTLRGAGSAPSSEGSKSSQMNLDSLYGKQVVFHVAGAVVKGYLRTGRRFNKNIVWKKRSEVLKNSFIEVEGSSILPVSEDIKEWTKSISRGKLIFVGLHCFNFFFECAKKILSCEEKNGSFRHSVVQGQVICDEIIYLWDKLVSTSLSTQHSLSFLSSVVQTLTNVIASGALKRRLNNILDKNSNIAVPMRKSIAR